LAQRRHASAALLAFGKSSVKRQVTARQRRMPKTRILRHYPPMQASRHGPTTQILSGIPQI
jgi:hypothetical protein